MFRENNLLYGSDDLTFENPFSNIDFYANLMPQPHEEDILPIDFQDHYANGHTAAENQHLTSRGIFGLEHLGPVAGMTQFVAPLHGCVQCDSVISDQCSHLTRERSGVTSGHGSNALLVCDRPSCTARGPFLNQSELKRHQGKHTRPYPCKVASCTVKPFADKAGLIRHGREVHGLKADGNPAPEFRCLVPGCQRGRKGFSRQHNLDQHNRRMHRRPTDKGGLQLPLPEIEGEGAFDDMSEMGESEGPETTGSTPVALGKSAEMITRAGAAPSQQLPSRGTATSIPVLQAELDMLKAQKLDAVRQYDDSISKLEGALAILRRGS
ncbi:hypothetical protein BDR22DRAFT_887508 [Usnea florida]